MNLNLLDINDTIRQTQKSLSVLLTAIDNKSSNIICFVVNLKSIIN